MEEFRIRERRPQVHLFANAGDEELASVNESFTDV
jgi:hypothetical protein